MEILSIDATTKVSDTLRFKVDYTITIGDIIDMVLLLLTVLGLIFTLVQLGQNKKINRATFVKELYWTLYSDIELRDIFYKIEWSNYAVKEFSICQTEDERKADKLFSFFDLICSMYYRKILTASDMNLFDYEMTRIYSHPSVKEYFSFLELWQESQKTQRSFENYRMYCEKFGANS